MSCYVPLAPSNLARPPAVWSPVEVTAWLKFCVEEYALSPKCVNNFRMNGKALIMLTRLDFIRRAPDSGDVLFNALQHLRHGDEIPAENNSTSCPRDMLPDSGTEPDIACSDDDGACPLLWEFLYHRLQDTDWSGVICWESAEHFTFRILKPEDLAADWGKQKHRSNMNYGKMSRAMRDYYKRNIIRRVIGKTLTYQFLQNPAHIQKCRRGARPHSKEKPTSEITKIEKRSPDCSIFSPAATKAETRSPDSSTFSPATMISVSPSAVEQIYNGHGRIITQSSIASHSPVEKLYNPHGSNVTRSSIVSPSPVEQLYNCHGSNVTQSSVISLSPVGQLYNSHGSNVTQSSGVSPSPAEKLYNTHGSNVTQSSVISLSPVGQLYNDHGSNVTQSSVVSPSPVEKLYNTHGSNVTQSSVISPSPVGQLYNGHGSNVIQSSAASHDPLGQSSNCNDNTVTSPMQYITIEKPSDCFESSPMVPNCQRSSFDLLATHEKFSVRGDYVTILKTENTGKPVIANRGHSFNQTQHRCMEMSTADEKYYSQISRSPTPRQSCDRYRDALDHQYRSAYQMPHKQQENESIAFRTTSHTVPCIAVVSPSRFVDTDSACSVLDRGSSVCTCFQTSPSQQEAFPDQTDDVDLRFNSNAVYRYPPQSLKRFKSLSPGTEGNKYHINNNIYQPCDIQYTHFSAQSTPDSTSQPMYISEHQRQRDIYVSCRSSLEHPQIKQPRKLPYADHQYPTESRWHHFTQHENTPCCTSGSGLQNNHLPLQSQPEDLSMKHQS